MRYLLDTNVISESSKPAPDANVRRWLETRDPAHCYLSAVTFAEIRRGVERTPMGARRRALEAWAANELMDLFAERLLPIDGAVAYEWGRLVARLEKRGRPMNPMDGLLAATALRHGLVLVTRNVADFAHTGLDYLDPWHAVVH